MVEHLKIVIVNDNVPREGLINDWGWSAYLVSERWHILFDADSRPDVMEYNGNKLGIDYSSLDFAVLSHHHWDHRGGFGYIAKQKKGLKIYVPPGDVEHLISLGMDAEVITNSKKLADDVWSSGTMGLDIKEHAMGVHVDSTGVVVIVGCAHPGVDKLTKRLRDVIGEDIYLVIGGFHQPSRRTLDRLADISRFISPAHCSGDAAKEYVKREYPSKYLDVRTGSVIEIKDGKHVVKF